MGAVQAQSCEHGRRAAPLRSIIKRARAAMTNVEGPHILEPVQAADGEAESKRWSYRLIVFLRVMAAISFCKGLYHWAVICGIGAPLPSGFDAYSTPYQVRSEEPRVGTAC